MRKKEKVIVFLLAFCLLLTGGFELYSHFAHRDRIRSVTVTIEDTGAYSAREVRAAVRIAEKKFQHAFPGKLINISYSSSKSEKEEAAWAAQYGAKNAIVLYSSFRTDPEEHGDSGLTPDMVYSGWKWVLVRNGKGFWTLKTWGCA